MQKTYKMSLILTLGKNIVAANTDDQRLRALNNFLEMYSKYVAEKSSATPIPTFGGQDAANEAVYGKVIDPNSLFIDSNNGSRIGVARFVLPAKKKG